MFKTIDLNNNTKEYTESDLINLFDLETSDLKFIGGKEKTIGRLYRKLERKGEVSSQEFYSMMIESSQNSIALGDKFEWKWVSARFFLKKLYDQVSNNLDCDIDGVYKKDYPKYIDFMIEKGLYGKFIKDEYTDAELKEAYSIIDPERDKIMDYVGLFLLNKTYLQKDKKTSALYELPQEKWLVAALDLARNVGKVNVRYGKDLLFNKYTDFKVGGREQRMEIVREIYWALSNLYIVLATPSMRAVGTHMGQYASCFVDTVEDSLRGIYDTNTDLATVSKNGAGVGVYMGRVRPRGASIRGFKEAASGVMGWLKGYENTAITVDQLKQRKGSFSPQLPLWHMDIISFISMRKNTGDDAIRTFELFPCVVVNDLFMELKNDPKATWYTFDPKEIYDTYGWHLDDFYDEVKGDPNGEFRKRYYQLVNEGKVKKVGHNAKELHKEIIKMKHETGLPYSAFIDQVNRMNPNNHAGRIYSTNLCTEIFQNMSATSLLEEYINPDTLLKEARWTPGDFVTCNLNSIVLPRVIRDNVLERVATIQARMLDSVIDINNNPISQAVLTMLKYRSVGAGTMGWAQLLIEQNIDWESEEAVAYADKIYGDWTYFFINANSDLAVEKFPYPLFEGSDWQTGAYFDKRGLTEGRWAVLAEKVARQGVRNGYMFAVAPNGSTAQVAGTTEGINPNFRSLYSVSKKEYKILTVVPGYNAVTALRYGRNNNGNAFLLDQKWSVRQNAARQLYIDQSQSFDTHILTTTTLRQLVDIEEEAWNLGMKSIYYTRSETLEAIENCEHCD